jgi:ABC-2 type transport system permease protein
MATSQGLRASLVRTFGFFRKELASVFRQPRLLMTLVLGPFLILLIFGIGYRENPPPFRTLLVLGGEEARLAANQADLGEAFGGSIDLVGTVTDQAEGRDRLESGEVDLLIVAPEEPLATLDSGEKAVFEVLHQEVDPVLRTSIDLIARLSIDEINRMVLADVVGAAQEESEQAEEPLTTLREGSDRLVAALEEGDEEQADQEVESMRADLAAVEEQSSESNDLYASVAAALGTTEEGLFDRLASQLDTVESGGSDGEALAEAQAMNETLDRLETRLGRAQEIEPQLLVSPFSVTVTQVHDVSRSPGIFYSPGTLVLLVQHLTLTFAALSLVRERQLGLTEVFRVSPLSTSEALIGKYLGFGAIAAAIAAVLSALLAAFGVDIGGPVLMYAVVMVLVILASLGLGFVISGLSRTDSQAVQYSMIALLVSIFFTGFVLPLERLAEPVQVVSYLIPATYGISALHDIIFRSSAVEPLVLAGLIVYSVVLGVAAWWMMRRDVTAQPA